MSDAYAYNIYYGTTPDKLYTAIMVLGNNEYWLKTLLFQHRSDQRTEPANGMRCRGWCETLKTPDTRA